GKGKPSGGAKLRGMERDSPEVRVSKTLSWLLRHGAANEGLPIRKDGFIKVDDVLNHPKLKAVSLGLNGLQDIVKADSKQRYSLIYEAEGEGASAAVPADESNEGTWWIKANQGHSIKTVELELKPIVTAADIPSGVAVHGTNGKAWNSISTQGLSKMKRNHIHLAQGIAGQNVLSGMRQGSQILIFIDVQKALDAGIKFFLSDNGVVLSEGDENGILKPEFFSRVENSKREPLEGWE
ncbi:phosphotransferase KptA/Tpt1, partial [Coprinopsis marcescibilis]